MRSANEDRDQRTCKVQQPFRRNARCKFDDANSTPALRILTAVKELRCQLNASSRRPPRAYCNPIRRWTDRRLWTARRFAPSLRICFSTPLPASLYSSACRSPGAASTPGCTGRPQLPSGAWRLSPRSKVKAPSVQRPSSAPVPPQGGSVLPGGGRPSARPATASGARASRPQSRHFPAFVQAVYTLFDPSAEGDLSNNVAAEGARRDVDAEERGKFGFAEPQRLPNGGMLIHPCALGGTCVLYIPGFVCHAGLEPRTRRQGPRQV